MHISNETTLFMQKAIYYVSKPVAARGMLELTDRRLLFQVFPFDASFGIKSLSIDITAIRGIEIQTGDIHPRLVVDTNERRHEFMLSKGRELYGCLKPLVGDPLGQEPTPPEGSEISCRCGKTADVRYAYCPWCGARFRAGRD